MPIIRWSPNWNQFEQIEDMMNRLPSSFSNFNLDKAFTPAMDIYEEKGCLIIKTPLAGILPEDVKVSVEKGVLTVEGSSKKEHEVDDKNYYRKEIRSGSFFRQVSLPAAVREDKVKAEFEDGILKIICPKSEPTQAKKIDVKVIKKNNKD